MDTKWKSIIRNNISGIRPIIFVLCMGAIVNMLMLVRSENLDLKKILDISRNVDYIESESFRKLIYDAIDNMGQIYTEELMEKLKSDLTSNKLKLAEDFGKRFERTESYEYKLNGENYEYKDGFLVKQNPINISIEEKMLSQSLHLSFPIWYTVKLEKFKERFSNILGNGWIERLNTPGIWLEYAKGQLRIKNNTDYNTDTLQEIKLPREYDQIKSFFFGFDKDTLEIADKQWKQQHEQIKNACSWCMLTFLTWIGLWIYMKKKKIEHIYFRQWMKWLLRRIRSLLQGSYMWTVGSITGRRWYKDGLIQMEKFRTLYTAAIMVICGTIIVCHIFLQEKQIPYELVPLICIGIIIFCVIFYARGSLDIANGYQKIINKIDDISNGEFDSEDEVEENMPFAKEMDQLSKIGISFEQNLEIKIRAERTKIELVTNVSHDLKTPLTSIISYIDLLQRIDNLPVEAREYIYILEQKSARLKAIVSDVFELAKTASGEIKLNIQQINVNKLLIQTLAALEDKIIDSGLDIKTHLCEDELYIDSDGQRLYRVLQNLLDNALKYSLIGTRIYIMEEYMDGRVEITVKNTANYEMDFSEEDVVERFFCGDKSRNTEGHGLGLSIAQGFTVSCGGEFQVKIDGDQFNVKLSFPISERAEEKDVKDI